MLHLAGGFPGGVNGKNPPTAVAQSGKSLPAMQETWVQSLGGEDPLEKEMATHSSILSWESHGQRSPAVYGVARVGYNWETKCSIHAADARQEGDPVRFLDGEDPLEKEILQYSYLGNPTDRGVWQATVHWTIRVGREWVTQHSHTADIMVQCTPYK